MRDQIFGARYLLSQIRAHSLLLFCVIFMFNTFVVSYLDLVASSIFISLLTLVILVSIPLKRAIFCLLAIALSTCVSIAEVQDQRHLDNLYNTVHEGEVIQGIIFSDPQLGHQNTTYNILINESDQEGLVGQRVSVVATKYPLRDIGDRCTFAIGRMNSTDSDSYNEYLQRKGYLGVFSTRKILCEFDKSRNGGVYLTIRRYLWLFKSKISKSVDRRIVEPYASLWLGILFGDDRLFSDEQEKVFMITQTTHIIAASGFNIAVAAGFLDRITKYMIGLRFRSLLIILVGFLVSLLADLSGSIIRAFISLILQYCARSTGRRYSSRDSVFYAFVLLSFLSRSPAYDLGFILSAVATLGVVLISPMVYNSYRILELPFYKRGFIKSLITNISCAFSVYPVMLLFFNEASFLGVISNFIIGNLVEYVYYVGFLYVCIFQRSSTFGGLVLNIQTNLLFLFVTIINFLAELFSISRFAKNLNLILAVVIFILICVSIWIQLRESSKLYLTRTHI